MQEIEDQDIVRRIRLENPWWQTGEIVASFRGWKPRAYLELFLPLLRQTSVRRAIILMGPRRIGKTVMIHHAIQSLIDAGIPPKNICYLSVDHPIYNTLSLEKFLEHYIHATEVDPSTNQIYIFFDEIQYLKNWETHLKVLVDTYGSIKAVASGSAAAALRLRSDESGAGRFTDFLLPPLTFYEYLELAGDADLVLENTNPHSPNQTGRYFTTSNIDRLNQKFVYYLNYGGYPEVIFSQQIQSDPARFIKSDIIDKVLLRDLPSLYGVSDIPELNYLFTTLAFNTANEISLGELSQKSGVAKNTIKRYIEYLEAAFLIKILHRIDRNAKRFARANYFKIYLTNPSMRAALFSPLDAEDPKLPYLAETAIFSQWFHSEQTLHYARWQGGEVDIVMVGSNQRPMWAVEVKWSDRHCDKLNELNGLIGFCKENKLPQARVTSKTKTMSCMVDGVILEFIPASVYCYTVGYNLIRGRKVFENAMPDLAMPSSTP